MFVSRNLKFLAPFVMLFSWFWVNGSCSTSFHWLGHVGVDRTPGSSAGSDPRQWDPLVLFNLSIWWDETELEGWHEEQDVV